jgi:hypothetical protein
MWQQGQVFKLKAKGGDGQPWAYRCRLDTLNGWASEALESELRLRAINSPVSFRAYALYDFTDKAVDACVRLSPHYYKTEQRWTRLSQRSASWRSALRAMLQLPRRHHDCSNLDRGRPPR